MRDTTNLQLICAVNIPLRKLKAIKAFWKVRNTAYREYFVLCDFADLIFMFKQQHYTRKKVIDVKKA